MSQMNGTTDGIIIFSRKIMITGERELRDGGMENYKGHYEELKKTATRSNFMNFGKELAENCETLPVINTISDEGYGKDAVYSKMIVISEERLAELLRAERMLLYKTGIMKDRAGGWQSTYMGEFKPEDTECKK